MSVGQRCSTWLLRSAALAVAGSIAFAGAVSAGLASGGQIGHYRFTDATGSLAGVKCKYELGNGGKYRLVQLVVKAPSAWWPDTNDGNDNQHGTVGWRAIISKAASGAGPWTVVKKTSIQKATAYEDTPTAFDPAKKAPFTNKKVGWDPSLYPGSVIRVKVKIFWYSGDGSVIGTAVHLVAHYLVKFANSSMPTEDYCDNKFIKN